MSSVLLAAGAKAYSRIMDEGLKPESVKAMLAASGGPKGLMLFGLDRYLLGEFFKDSTAPVDLLGTSIGAWRMACYAQNDPLAALERFVDVYMSQTYPEGATRLDVTKECERLLDGILDKSGAAEIAHNHRFRFHTIAGKSKGWAAREHGALLGPAMVTLALSNAISKRAPFWFFDRVMFKQASSQFPWHSRLPLAANVDLTPENVRGALMATASIPLVLTGVTDIKGAPDGVYRDGGMTDYHLSMPMSDVDGVVLYPHFFPRVVPGWFDKSLSWRIPNADDFSHVLVLSPSQEFINSLPYSRIPDRKDFMKLNPQDRVAYWKKVLQENQRMVDELHDLLSSGRIRHVIKPLKFEKYGQITH